MSEADTTPAAQSVTPTGFAGLPRWLRIGLIAAVTAVVVLIIAVAVRVALQTPVIPTGPTSVDRLVPGACLLEPGDADEYTVVPCSTPHQQQVIASVDLAFPGVPYTADESLAVYAQETCLRLVEYKLYLPDDIVKSDYTAAAISAPTLEQYDAGDTETLCAVLDHPDRPEDGGVSEDLTRDLYRPIPE
ncbi:MAG: septum formation family protein [Pseudolysinimonas sp.]